MTHEPPPDAPASPRFSDVLREATNTVHREAERTGFIADLIRARATRAGYVLFLQNLVPAYEALEHALVMHRDDPSLGAFADPRLHRLEALRNDLEALDASSSDATALPAARAYAASVTRAAASPARLAAHAYARYLGDLSGGQILKPVLARTLGLTSDALTFYDFPALDDLAAAKSNMRATLDRIVVGSTAAEAFVEEAIAAFRHNIAVSEAVQRALV